MVPDATFTQYRYAPRRVVSIERDQPLAEHLLHPLRDDLQVRLDEARRLT